MLITKTANTPYSYSKIYEGMKRVKTINRSVKRKSDHIVKANELEVFCEWCMNNINSSLFNPELTIIGEYKKAACNYKNYKKKELADLLNRCKQYLRFTLNDIYCMMNKGLVETIA